MSDISVLIVGGGIQGVGLLHDLASRGIHDVLLVEQKLLASGTSSRSTKLLHGGLRYLEHLNQWGLVREALHERSLLLRLLKGVVQPVPFVLPNFKGNRPAWMVRMGLFLYDALAGDSGLPSARRLNRDEIKTYAPYIKPERVDSDMESAFLYYDGQMLDDVIVRLAAEASVRLGAQYLENTTCETVTPLPTGGHEVRLQTPEGSKTLRAQWVINAAGPWCNANLLRWGITPQVPCLLNVGSHIVFEPEAVKTHEPGQAAASLFQNEDGRVVFFIPWYKKWLFGTTESILQENPRGISPPPEDISYLMTCATNYLDLKNPMENKSESFAGVRCMPLKRSKHMPHKIETPSWQEDPFHSPWYLKSLDASVSGLSRETIIDQTIPGVLSIYGGKYTTYRAQSEKIGSLIAHHLGRGGKSGTHTVESWFLHETLLEKPHLFQSSPDIRRM